MWVQWIKLCGYSGLDCVGFANSFSAVLQTTSNGKPQAMDNINDCPIQSFSFCCNYIHVLWFGKLRTIIFANPTQSTVPWLQRHHLLYMGFVHCGGTFETPTHYGTNIILYILLHECKWLDIA